MKKKIIKKIKVGNTTIKAVYQPALGFLDFVKDGGSTYEKTGEGAFNTMNKLTETFKEFNPREIRYYAGAETLREAKIKDRLYARTLKKSGYTLHHSMGKFGGSLGEYIGPIRLYTKNVKGTENQLNSLPKNSKEKTSIEIMRHQAETFLKNAKKKEKDSSYLDSQILFNYAGDAYSGLEDHEKALSAYENSLRMIRGVKASDIPKSMPHYDHKKNIGYLKVKIKEEKSKCMGYSNQGLENQLVAMIPVFSFVIGLFFLSSNITGNVISDSSVNAASWIGIILLVIGLITGFFELKKLKKC